MAKYRQCTRCLMDTSDTKIVFNDAGHCNHCIKTINGLKNNKLGRREWFHNNRYLGPYLEQIKTSGSEYDAILGISGGVDSCYAAKICASAGLKILAIHVDAGWNSESAIKNIENTISYCGFDLITYIVEWDEIRTLQREIIKSGTSNLDVVQDHVFFAVLFYLARKHKIKKFISGGNFATESIMPVSWHEGNALDSRFLKYFAKKSGLKYKSFKFINFFEHYLFNPYFRKIKTYRPLNYLKYNRDSAIKEMDIAFGWSDYGGKHCESIFTKVFQYDFLRRRYGFDKRIPHYSSIICSGGITRSDAILELEKNVYSTCELNNDLRFFCEKLQLDRAQYEEFLLARKASYFDYPNWSKLEQGCIKLQKLFKRLV